MWDGDTPEKFFVVVQNNLTTLFLWVYVCFHMTFKIFFSISVKISVGMLVWFVLNL